MTERPRSLSDQGRLARWLPRVTLLAVYGYLLTLLVPYLLYNNALKGDGAGHLQLIELTARHLLPFGSGWSDRIWTGFPAGQLYSPLFHLAGALLARLHLPVPLAARLLIVVVWLLLPLVLYRVAGRLAESASPESGLLCTQLFLALWAALNVPSQVLGLSETLGTNLQSSLDNGMFPSALGALFALLLLDTLLRPRPTVGRVGGLVALTVLSHPVWGLVGALLAVVSALADLVPQSPLRGARFRLWLGAALVALGLSAFFVVPMVLHGDQMRPSHMPTHWPVTLWVGVLAALGLAVFAWRRLPLGLRSMAVTLALLLAAAGLGSALVWPFHFYRLTIPALVLALPLLVVTGWRPGRPAPIGRRLGSRLQRLLRGANLVLLAGLCAACHLLGPVRPQGNPDLPLPDLAGYSPDQGRILVLADDLHSPGYMALPYVTLAAGGAVSHGISVESAPAASAVFTVASRLNSRQYVWGIDVAATPGLRVPDPDFAIARRQLRILGFSHILTDLRLPVAALGAQRPANAALTFPNFLTTDAEALARLRTRYHLDKDGRTFQVYLHRLPEPALAEGGIAMLGVPRERFRELSGYWFAEGGRAPVPVAGWRGALEPRADVEARVTTRSRDGARLELAVHAGDGEAGPVGIFLRVPYHANWSARSRHGDALPLYPAGTGMLLLAPPGQCTVEYRAGFATWAGRAMTLLTLSLLLLGGVRRWRKGNS